MTVTKLTPVASVSYEECPFELLMTLLAQVQETKELAIKDERQIKDELHRRFFTDIEAALKLKDEPFGAVPVTFEDYKLTFTVPKKVEWDQDMLAEAYQSIKMTNENPADYLDVKYNVPESKYKAWPEVLKEKFIDARMVIPGAVTVKFERIEE